MNPKYIPLRTHSDYSIINSILKVNQIVASAKRLSMPAVALTDIMNLCGSVKFYKECVKANIKPIIGSDLYFYSDLNGTISTLTALVKNDVGHKNLKFLISLAHKRGYSNEQPYVTHQDLLSHKDGLIFLSGGVDGVIGQAIIDRRDGVLSYYLDFFASNFGDNFYLEISRVNSPRELEYLADIFKLANEYDLPVVATNLALMETKDQFNIHDIRAFIHSGFTILDKNRPNLYTDKQFFISAEAMADLFFDCMGALENTVAIAQRCNLTLTFGDYFLPKFPTGKLSEGDFLIEAARGGLEDKLNKIFPDAAERSAKQDIYFARLEEELGIINDMGFPGYFLIVMEFIQWSKVEKIPVGPGRGSGAGSLVAYALDITSLDPIAFDLLFERFLNPERVSMPDFDVDFCMDRRDDVIAHTADVYGRDSVSQIITFGTMSAKSVIRDVGRVLGHSYSFADRIAKLIPNDLGITIQQALTQEQSLSEMYREDEEIRDLIDISLSLEGLVRNVGKHAGGVVISPTYISDFSALHCDSDGLNPVTQLDKGDIESIGLVKFDFLGLRTLTIIDSAIININLKLKDQGLPPLLIDEIPLDDPKSFEVLASGNTTAVFQLESSGMKDLICKLGPDSFEDIIALVALFRPGPLQSGMVDNFIDRKKGIEAVSYPDENYQHHLLEKILQPTYGIILYQEQVMQIAQALAGYSLGDADLLRRAMGKKQPEEMAKQRDIFKSGAINNGIDGDLAMKIFDLVEKFAGYGFNKSHSAAYALLSYQTLWLKVNYPSYFLAAVLSSDMDNTDKVVHFLEECKRMHIEIAYPNINKSQYDFIAISDSTIVYGLGAIKGVGLAATQNIMSCRQDGPFKDLFDFCQRVDLQKVNKRVLEKLVFSGAFDLFNVTKSVLLGTITKATQLAQQILLLKEKNQASFFDSSSNEGLYDTSYVNSGNLNKKEILSGEYDTLGFYVTDHPMSCYTNQLRTLNITAISDLQVGSAKKFIVAGLLRFFRIKSSKSGKRIGILQVVDSNESVDILLYEEQLIQYKSILKKNQVYLIEVDVKLDRFSGGKKVIGSKLSTFNDYRINEAKEIILHIHDNLIHASDISKIHSLLLDNPGSCDVSIKYYCNELSCRLLIPCKVNPSDFLIDPLENILGNSFLDILYK